MIPLKKETENKINKLYRNEKIHNDCNVITKTYVDVWLKYFFFFFC